MDESQAFDGSAGISAPAMRQMALAALRQMPYEPTRE